MKHLRHRPIFGSTNMGTWVNNLGDINGDGVLDIITADTGPSENGNTFSIFLSNTRRGLAPLDLTSRSTSRSALDTVRTQRQQVTSAHATIGAAQSRLETAARILQTTTENYAAAESRIKDTDIAQDAANLTRQSILRQVASAVLAQANQQPTIALQILQSS